MIVKSNAKAAISLLLLPGASTFILIIGAAKTKPLSYVLLLLVGLLLLNIILALYFLREYKTFEIYRNKLKISFSFYPYRKIIFDLELEDIVSILIIRFSIQSRITPVLSIKINSSKGVVQKKMKFRMDSNEIEFQQLIDTMRLKGVIVNCEGDVWI